jgi:hypothetical protein
MGDRLGVEVPWEEEVVLIPSRRQGRHREVGSCSPAHPASK